MSSAEVYSQGVDEMEERHGDGIATLFVSSLSPLIRPMMRRNRITGLSVALVDDCEFLHAEGYGFADKESGRPATVRTVYRIGSVTKAFTGTTAVRARLLPRGET
ncbi:MAG TPA: serine hydrolase domain-containing protein [Spirochaetia bacterium]|nr:serine hydrolase domain-containing protein [Spirochaetia bacterium]